MKTKLYTKKKVAKMAARTFKVCNPDFSYLVGRADDKPSPSVRPRRVRGYFCIRKYAGKDFHSFA